MPNLILTGHSLGGGIAQYEASTHPALKAVTFNAAPIGTAFPTGPGDQILNIRMSNDPVSQLSGWSLGRDIPLAQDSFYSAATNGALWNPFLSSQSLLHAHGMDIIISALTNAFVNGRTSGGY